MKPSTLACPDCGRTFIPPIHACRADRGPNTGGWSLRAAAAARHAQDVASREKSRVDLGLVPASNFSWAAQLEGRANLVLAYLRETRSTSAWSFAKPHRWGLDY